MARATLFCTLLVAAAIACSGAATAVTALFDIHREHHGDGRKMAVYVEWIARTLALDVAFVIFVQREYADAVRGAIPESARVVVIEQDLREVPYYDVRARIDTVLKLDSYRSRVRDPGRVECVNAMYNVIQYSKFEWLRNASEANYFQSDFFFWVDAGASRFFDGVDLAAPWPSPAFPLPQSRLLIQGRGDMVTYLAGKTPNDLALDSQNLLIGTVFGAQRRTVSILAVEMRAIVDEMLKNSTVANEQLGLAILFLRRPALFRVVLGQLRILAYLSVPPAAIPWLAPASDDGCGASSPAKKYAVATLVSSSAYIDGANVLLYSLRKFMDPVIAAETDFVALLVREHPDVDQVSAALRGWRTCKVPLVPPPFDGAVPFERFREQFTKLALWNMTAFRRVLYLDSDTVATGDPSPMLLANGSAFAAVQDWEGGAVRAHFNMGVCSLRPDAAEFARLMDLRATKRDYRMGMAEQGLLNSLYADTFEKFPFEYNGNLAAAAQNATFWAEHSRGLRIIHYTWIKPFDPRRETNGDYAACAAPIALWWKLKGEMEGDI